MKIHQIQLRIKTHSSPGLNSIVVLNTRQDTQCVMCTHFWLWCSGGHDNFLTVTVSMTTFESVHASDAPHP